MPETSTLVSITALIRTSASAGRPGFQPRPRLVTSLRCLAGTLVDAYARARVAPSLVGLSARFLPGPLPRYRGEWRLACRPLSEQGLLFAPTHGHSPDGCVALGCSRISLRLLL